MHIVAWPDIVIRILFDVLGEKGSGVTKAALYFVAYSIVYFAVKECDKIFIEEDLQPSMPRQPDIEKTMSSLLCRENRVFYWLHRYVRPAERADEETFERRSSPDVHRSCMDDVIFVDIWCVVAEADIRCNGRNTAIFVARIKNACTMISVRENRCVIRINGGMV